MTDYTLDDQPVGSARYHYGDLESVIMLLWDQLCDGKIGGNIFRKKYHRDDFVIDFCCFQKKLAIIISDENPSYNDYYSDLFGNLYWGGFRVAMFPKQDVMNNIDKVIVVIRALLDLPGNRKTSPGGTTGEVGGGIDRRMIIQKARDMRRNPTKAEAALWKVLRGKQLDGFKFRRQHPIGPYITDFFCPKKKLIIEVDGGQHAEQGKKDAERTAFFESKGCRVIRFWNNEVLGNIQGVVDRIAEELDN